MLSFQHDEREAPLGHIQVNGSSGRLDVHLRQETGVTHLGAVIISGLWHPGTERQGHQEKGRDTGRRDISLIDVFLWDFVDTTFHPIRVVVS